MKRFIALVLSLVMALSLCVPAWGETVNVADADALAEALAAGKDVVLASDIKIDPANLSNAYGTTGINVKNGETIDGGNHTLDTRGANGTWDSCINTTGGIIKNITVTGAFRGIFINHNSSHSEKVILENVTTTGTTYTISCDQGTNQGLEATNCAFYGWTSYAGTLGNAVFTNCTFGEGSGYAYCRPYAPTTFVGCTFEEGFRMDPRAEVFFDNCKLGDAALTANNLATLVPSNIANAKVLGSAAAPEVKEEVEAAEPKVEVSASVTDTASAAIVAGGVEIDETELESVATDIAASTEVSETEVVTALQSNGVSAAAGATVVVQPYFDVAVEDVDVANGTIALDITPMYQVVAATDPSDIKLDGTGKNAAVIGDPQEMTIPEGKSVEITVQIPDALAANGKLYVAHDGSELYEATVTGTAGAYFATFTTTSGFSPYVFYTDLQALLAAAAVNGDTVTLMGNVELPEELVLPDGVTLDGNGYTISVDDSATWVFAVLGSETKHLMELGNNCTVKNVTLDSENKVYGVQAYCVTGVKLDNVTIKNSKGAGLTVNGSDVEAVNLKASGNAWGSVNVDPGSGVTSVSEFTVSGANTNLADATAIWSDGNNVTAGTNDVEVAISGGTYSGAITVADGKGTVAISSGSFAVKPNSAYLASGFSLSQNSAGNYVAGAVTSSTAGDYKIYANTVAGTLHADVNENVASIFTKVPAAAPKMGDNLAWVGGNIEYYIAKDLGFNDLYFYEVTDKDDATHVIKNGKTVYKYVIMMSDPSEAAYTYTATVSKNTAMNSSDCGKVNVVGWDKKSVLYTYVDSNGLVQFATDDASAAANGTIRLNAAGVVDDYYKVNVNPHTFYPTYTKGDISGATCGKCGLVANRVKSAASLPEKYVLVTSVTCNGAFAGNILYYVPSTASLPSGGVVSGPIVESAETFDAGIAMYVGMSVMAAAGSAVVIGKKKD